MIMNCRPLAIAALVCSLAMTGCGAGPTAGSCSSANDVNPAMFALSEALQKAEEFDLRPLAAQCHLGLGKRYRSAGQRGKAEQHLKTAAAQLQKLGMQFWLEQAQSQLAALA